MARKIIQGTEQTFVFRFALPSGDPFDLTPYDEIRFCFADSSGGNFYKKRIVRTGDTLNTNVTISNIDVTDLEVGDPISGTGIPSGATISSIGVNSIDISAPATATNLDTTLTFGDILFVGDPVLGKINITLSEADTDLLPVGLNNTEVKLVQGGITKYQQMPNFLNVVARYC